MPLSSQASIALSASSLRITNGQSSTAWPVCAVSSFSEQKSNSRDVRKVVRLNDGFGFDISAMVLIASSLLEGCFLPLKSWRTRRTPLKGCVRFVIANMTGQNVRFVRFVRLCDPCVRLPDADGLGRLESFHGAIEGLLPGAWFFRSADAEPV
jgi:hypothetical protein